MRRRSAVICAASLRGEPARAGDGWLLGGMDGRLGQRSSRRDAIAEACASAPYPSLWEAGRAFSLVSRIDDSSENCGIAEKSDRQGGCNTVAAPKAETK